MGSPMVLGRWNGVRSTGRSLSHANAADQANTRQKRTAGSLKTSYYRGGHAIVVDASAIEADVTAAWPACRAPSQSSRPDGLRPGAEIDTKSSLNYVSYGIRSGSSNGAVLIGEAPFADVRAPANGGRAFGGTKAGSIP